MQSVQAELQREHATAIFPRSLLHHAHENTSADAAPMKPKKGAVSWFDMVPAAPSTVWSGWMDPQEWLQGIGMSASRASGMLAILELAGAHAAAVAWCTQGLRHVC